jgi:hypothetical protein
MAMLLQVLAASAAAPGGGPAELIGGMRFDRPRHLGLGYNCDDFKGFAGAGSVVGSFEHGNWQGSQTGGASWQPPFPPSQTVLPLIKGSVLVNRSTRFSMALRLPKGKGPHFGWSVPNFTAFSQSAGGQYPFSARTVSRTMSFSGVPQPGLLTVQGAGGSGGSVILGDGTLLMSMRVMWAGAPGAHNNPNSTRATSIIAFHSSNGGYDWTYRGSVMDAASMLQSLEGPSEHDLVMLADNKTVLCITRLDGGDGSRSWILPYGRAVSSNGGQTWSPGTVLPKGVGSARPSLMRTADGQVVLSGGRLSPTNKDVRVWLNSGRGLGLQPWRAHSVSYLHNSMEPNKTLHFTALVNYSHTHAESLSYTSIVQTGPQTGVVIYEGSFSLPGNQTWAGRPFLPPLAFAMPFTVAAMEPPPPQRPQRPERPQKHTIAAQTIKCDVVVAGGSTASLAAAVTAATAAPNASVCLADPTDWVGGQMTASAVSAFDFGANASPAHQSKSFRDLMTALGAPRNPGACWVSEMCYEPVQLLERWVRPALAALPNLRVLNRTVVTGVEPCLDAAGASNRTICALTMVQRTAKTSGGAAGWSRLLSESLEDWYDPVPSPDFEKASLRLEGSVFIDATEFGDVLVSGAATALKLPVVQGIEEPEELSPTTDDQCGQAATLTFYMGIRNRTGDAPQSVPPGSMAQGAAFDIPMDGEGHLPTPWAWDDIWLYRRARLGSGDEATMTRSRCAARHASEQCAPQLGDLTQQNWGGGNDLDNAYPFIPLHAAVEEAKAGRHRGGMNLTALSMLEQRAYGWYHYFKNHWPESNSSSALPGAEIFLDQQATGTKTGLAKMPYLRDTRRSVGLDGFRMAYTAISHPVDFADTVAIGSYAHDTHGLSICKMPSYLEAPAARPYFIPFRALTNSGAENLLVAGKTMATTFSANSATRLHPDEWSSGVAAGAAAALLAAHHSVGDNSFSTTRELLAGEGLVKLRALLNSSAIEQPLDWGVEPTPRPAARGRGLVRALPGDSPGKPPTPMKLDDVETEAPHDAYLWAVGDTPPDLKESFATTVHGAVPEIKIGRMHCTGGGAFPCLACGKSIGDPLFCNGGIPQLVNMSLHLAGLRHDLVVTRGYPRNYTGHVVLDFEYWHADRTQPPDEWASAHLPELYKNASIAFARSRHKTIPEGQLATTAQHELAAAMTHVLSASLLFVRQLFPHACGVGFYGYPSNHYWPLPAHENQTLADEALLPLWQASTAVYPSVYLPYPSGPGEHHQKYSRNQQYIDSVLSEAQRVARLGAIDGRPLPILPFAWYRYDNNGSFRDGHRGGDFLSVNDTLLAFVRPFTHHHVSSVVIWGAEKTKDAVADTEAYFHRNAALFASSRSDQQTMPTPTSWPAARRATINNNVPPPQFPSSGSLPPYTPCLLTDDDEGKMSSKTCASLGILPIVQHCSVKPSSSSIKLRNPWTIATKLSDSAAKFAATKLQQNLSSTHGIKLLIVDSASLTPTSQHYITVGVPVTDPNLVKLANDAGFHVNSSALAALKPEGYQLSTQAGTVFLLGSAPAGAYYAVQSMMQLVATQGVAPNRARLPCGTAAASTTAATASTPPKCPSLCFRTTRRATAGVRH